MLKVMKMSNAERFLEIVEQSRGDVWLYFLDGSRCDLKRDRTAKQMLRNTASFGNEGLHLCLSDPNDAPAFLQYLCSAN